MNQRAQYHVTNIARGTTDPGNSYQLKLIHIQLSWKDNSSCMRFINVRLRYWLNVLLDSTFGCHWMPNISGHINQPYHIGKRTDWHNKCGWISRGSPKKKNLQYKFVNHFLQASISLSFIYIHARKIPLAFEKFFVQITCAACIIYCCNFSKRDH